MATRDKGQGSKWRKAFAWVLTNPRAFAFSLMALLTHFLILSIIGGRNPFFTDLQAGNVVPRVPVAFGRDLRAILLGVSSWQRHLLRRRRMSVRGGAYSTGTPNTGARLFC
jgi:hypothetical protein